MKTETIQVRNNISSCKWLVSVTPQRVTWLGTARDKNIPPLPPSVCYVQIIKFNINKNIKFKYTFA